MLYASVFLLPAFFGLLWVLRRDSMERGKLEKEKDEMQGALDDVHLVQSARNRLKSVDAADIALRDKLHNKYKRD